MKVAGVSKKKEGFPEEESSDVAEDVWVESFVQDVRGGSVPSAEDNVEREVTPEERVIREIFILAIEDSRRTKEKSIPWMMNRVDAMEFLLERMGPSEKSLENLRKKHGISFESLTEARMELLREIEKSSLKNIRFPGDLTPIPEILNIQNLRKSPDISRRLAFSYKRPEWLLPVTHSAGRKRVSP
jgi:hypothetical protein